VSQNAAELQRIVVNKLYHLNKSET